MSIAPFYRWGKCLENVYSLCNITSQKEEAVQDLFLKGVANGIWGRISYLGSVSFCLNSICKSHSLTTRQQMLSHISPATPTPLSISSLLHLFVQGALPPCQAPAKCCVCRDGTWRVSRSAKDIETSTISRGGKKIFRKIVLAWSHAKSPICHMNFFLLMINNYYSLSTQTHRTEQDSEPRAKYYIFMGCPNSRHQI